MQKWGTSEKVVLSLPLLIIAISYTLAHEALASSPSFHLQQLLDSRFDWIDMASGNRSREDIILQIYNQSLT